jgi:ribonuclease R
MIEKGKIRLTRSGAGYLDLIDGQSIRVSNSKLALAMNNDEVEVIAEKGMNERLNGEVRKIIKRARIKFVGTVDKEDGKYFVIPDDKKFYLDIFIPKKYAGKIKNKQKVQVEILNWGDAEKNPEAKILKIIGKRGEHEVEMQSILLEKGVELGFPPKVEQEAVKILGEISEEEISRRKDMRGILTFTIDPVDAKDFDDAVSFKNLPDGNIEIGVHIADVSHYVKPNTELDKEAQKRGFSVYLVDRTIPMLPEVLSNDVCSLNPNEDKLTFSAVFEFNKEGKRVKHWVGRTVINSNKRFSYQEAQEEIDTGNGDFVNELRTLNELAKKMHAGRVKRGSILFDRDEIKIELDKHGKPIDIYKKKRLDTHKLIEEYMLLANREVTEHVEKHCKKKDLAEVFVYRTHDLPDEEKIEALAIFLKGLGYNLNVDGGVKPEEINRLLEEVKGKPEENLIKTSLIRSMAKAEYSTKNIGHFGLAFRFYTHFTSPIRRYPDLLVHRLVERHLRGELISKRELSKYQKLSLEASRQEIAAAEAERDSKKYKQIEYMQKKIGQTFEGIISGITDWGLYVEEIKTGTDGLIGLSTLKDDYYRASGKYSVEGEKSGKRYNLGDKVKIKLVGADLDQRTIDYTFI